ncbi:MAG: 5'/3'-nucleotidase SurE [Bacteroidetes bacterium]|nr:MAG: 5'/3'-nucleotidase SurE [Bacteroidota bacterium]
MPASAPLLLISNDDGIQAPGILSLIEVARQFGEVAVVAPDSAQSGMGHAISVGKPLRIFREQLPGGLTGYAVNGTPADCVKIATGVILDRRPDLILSGINHGSNASVSSIYSGTLSAAREGALQGIPAIGFSLCNYQHDADMHTAQEVATKLIAEALAQPLGPGQLLNVNVPDVHGDAFKGIRLTRQAVGRWVEEFDERTDPYGRKYYWLTGRFALMDEGEDTDEYALRQGYASVTPMMSDLTDYAHKTALADWDLSL